MKSYQRIISLLLIFSLCAGVRISSLAQNNMLDAVDNSDEVVSTDLVDDDTAVSKNIPVETIRAIQNTIDTIAFEKEHYGFKDVDLSTIQIGVDIPLYEVVNNDIVPLENIKYYPIFDKDNRLVSIAATAPSPSGNASNMIVSLSTSLVSELCALCKTTQAKSTALVYDKHDVYLWNGDTLSLLTASWTSNHRSELTDENLDELRSVKTAPLSAVSHLTSSKNAVQPQGYDDEAAYISVPVKRQANDTYWCWAACMASIVEWEYNSSYTTTQMANLYTHDTSLGMTMPTVISNLQNSFSLPYQRYIGDSDNQNLVNILNSLGARHAVCGGFSGSGNAHMSIIRGINFGSSSCSVMDPRETGSNYITGLLEYQGNTGSLSYFSSVGACTLELIEYAYMTP